MSTRYPNVAKVELIAQALGSLSDRLVFVGGCAVDSRIQLLLLHE